MSPRRVVVFGGTFDPVHNGHVAIAKYLRDELPVELVVMVPAGRPWLRPDAPVATPEDRLRMVELAVEDENGIEVSDVDILRDKMSYSIDTINDLRSRYGVDCEFILAIGADAAADLSSWHRYEDLINESRIVVVERPGWPTEFCGALPTGTLVIPGPMIDVSASELREMIGCGDIAKTANVLPDLVLRFIIENRLYRCGPSKQ